MFGVTSSLHSTPINRAFCRSVYAYLLEQEGRQPEIKKEKSSNGYVYIQVIDHSRPIFDPHRATRNKIIGYQ